MIKSDSVDSYTKQIYSQIYVVGRHFGLGRFGQLFFEDTFETFVIMYFGEINLNWPKTQNIVRPE